MDFAKFVWLLETGQLYFSRSDKFDDPYEGTLPQKVREYVAMRIKENGAISVLFKTFQQHYPTARKATYVNCWHLNDNESAAMWGLYSKNKNGIALQSRYKSLRDSLHKATEEIFIGEVSYRDYSSDENFRGNFLSPFYSKMKSYEHEKEVRAIMQDINFVKHTMQEADLNPLGKLVKIDLTELIECIYVNPFCPQWFFDIVNGVCKKYDLHVKTTKSDLSIDPVF